MAYRHPRPARRRAWGHLETGVTSTSRIAVIVNPASRSGKSDAVRRVVVELAEKHRVPVFSTEHRGHATEIAARLSAEGFERVVAVGGDGTLNEVANGLAGTQTALAAVPAGTGNDWVRTVGVPRDPTQAWKLALTGQIEVTDLAEVEGHGFCMNVLGAGFDAEVARRIAAARGPLAGLGPTPRYVAAVFGTFFGYERSTVRVRLDDGPIEEVPETLLVAVGVAKYYGSGMMVLPDAEIADGLLDVVWGSGISVFELPGIMRRVFKGTHTSHPRVRTARCRSVTLESDSPTPFHIDGDVRGLLPITVRVRENALRIVVP
ncbi:MAG: diacylglycerol kinase family protein [Fimbriimonadaceae bacterium]